MSDQPEFPIANSSAESFERIERFQTLQAGHYWRSIQADHDQGIAAGTVLLLQSVRCVEDKPHTIILRAHPSKFDQRLTYTWVDDDGNENSTSISYNEHRFLVDDFLNLFEFEPDHQAVRTAELAQVQAKVNAAQKELMQAQSDPKLLTAVVEAGLKEWEADKAEKTGDATKSGSSVSVVVNHDPVATSMATGSLSNAIGTGITAERIESMKSMASREHQVATIKSAWIQKKTQVISDAIAAMTPYFTEHAAAALAHTEEVRTYVKSLMSGIASLDLYVGKDVDVFEIAKGESAATDVPLTFVQKKLFMDEELAVWVDIEETFDFECHDTFFDALRSNPGFIDQVFPTKRCILVMATSRRWIKYGSAYENAAKNAANKTVFMLARDGQNVYRIYSPVESHLNAGRLFPSRDEHNAIFRGVRGEDITFENVGYTDRLAAHDSSALHYKRFLILTCGLDHRLKLFGDFYAGQQSFDFVSLRFQTEYCRFLHDDDAAFTLPGEVRQDVRQWVADKNRYLKPGSRVLCNWREVMTYETAPGACDYERHGETYFRYDPKELVSMAIAFKDATSVCVTTAVEGRSARYDAREFNCKVNLTKYKGSSEVGFLCLDAVTEEDLHWYIHNRGSRRDMLFYVRYFKRALKIIQQEKALEAGTRKALRDALVEGRITSVELSDSLIDQAVMGWRASHRGQPLPQIESGIAPRVWQSLLDQLFQLAGNGKNRVNEVGQYVQENLGLEPLRLAISGKAGNLIVYAAPSAAERDDRLQDHRWVHKIALATSKAGYSVKTDKWVLLSCDDAAETTIHVWPQLQDWQVKSSDKASFHSPEHKAEVFDTIESCVTTLSPYLNTMTGQEFDDALDMWERVRAECNEHGTQVSEPVMAFPVAVTGHSEGNAAELICIGTDIPHAVLYQCAPDDERRRLVRSKYLKLYRDKNSGAARFDGQIARFPWELRRGPVVSLKGNAGYVIPYIHGNQTRELHRKPKFNPLLSTHFMAWLADENRCSDKQVCWIAPNLRVENGGIDLDTCLNNVLPADYQPLNIYVVTPFDSTNKSMPELTTFEIVGSEIDHEVLIKRNKLTGYSTRSHTATSYAAARSIVAGLARDMGVKIERVPADLNIAGHERYVIVKEDKQS